MATHQPTAVTQVRRVGSTTASRASPNPMVTQAGGTPVAGAQREQLLRPEPGRGQARRLQAGLADERDRVRQQVQRPGEEHEERHHRDDGGVHRDCREQPAPGGEHADREHDAEDPASRAKAAATATSRPTAQAARRAFLGVPVSIGRR